MRKIKIYTENEEKAVQALKAAGFVAKVVTRWTEAGENVETGNRWSVSFTQIETDCSGNRAHALWVAAGVVPENPNFKTRNYSRDESATDCPAFDGQQCTAVSPGCTAGCGDCPANPND